MTGHAFKEDIDRCLQSGMDAYIAKPIDLKRTLEVVKSLMGQGAP
jgi:CheY-like chemotaxis protein